MHHLVRGSYPCSVAVTQSCPTRTTPWTVAHQAPLSMGFSRQEYWSGLPFPSPGDGSSRPRAQTRVCCIASRLFTNRATGEAPVAVPRAAHWPGTILQHPLQVGAILHVAREGAGHHIGAPVSSPCPQRSKRHCLTGGQSLQQSSTRPAGCPCCSPSPPAWAPHNSSQPGVPACLSAHEASCPSWFPAQHLRGL